MKDISGTPAAPGPVEEDAIAWAVRTSDPDFADWDGFLAWLAGDPSRQDAYDAVTVAVAQAADVLPPAPARAAEDNVVRLADRRRWRVAVASGLALAAGVAGVMLVAPRADVSTMRVIDAPQGQPATLALADGSRITLAGGARLRVDPAQPRQAMLDRGRAIFTVRHDAAAPFHVVAGGHRIVDAGTVFEVALAPGSTAVAVAEGRVIVDPSRLDMQLRPGDAAELQDGRAARVTRVPPGAIGQWRQARMSYRDAPLARVAGDLSVALGHPISVAESLRTRRFSGTLIPATLRDRPRDLAAVLDVRVEVGAQGWEIRDR